MKSALCCDFCRRLTFSTLLLLTFVQICRSSSQSSNIYGVDLELLKIRPAQPATSFQFELQVDYSHFGNMIDYGVVTVRAVAANHELLFPEVVNRNPFSLRVESQGVVCFRLYQTSKVVVLEDCLQIRDLQKDSYYNTETFTKTKADGTTLTYKIAQYLIIDENGAANSNLLSDDAPHEHLAAADAQSGCPLCYCTCTVSTVFAILEGIALTVIAAVYSFVRFRNAVEQRKLKQSTSTLARAVNNGMGGHNVASPLAWTTAKQEIYSTASTVSSDSVKADDSASATVSNVGGSNDSVDAKLAHFRSALATTSKSAGKKMKEILRNAKFGTNDEPPEPPPPDYRNEAFDVDEPAERVYDTINERHLENIVYKK